MITILGGPKWWKKGGSKRAPNKCPITPRDPLEPQPREGGRGKGKPSQLEDWKSLKPKPPQPRGLVGFMSLCKIIGFTKQIYENKSLSPNHVFTFDFLCTSDFNAYNYQRQRRYGYKSTFTINPTSPLGWGGLGLRLFQSSNWEGLPFPLPPSLGCVSRRSRSLSCILFGARFGPPFFHHLGPPQIVITSYSGSKAIPFWGPKRGPKQAPTSELVFSLIFLGFLIFSIPPQVPPV